MLLKPEDRWQSFLPCLMHNILFLHDILRIGAYSVAALCGYARLAHYLL